MRYIISIFFLGILISSCEEQMIPIPERSLEPTGRVVLMEEFTGVRCGPCYDASFVAKEMVDNANGDVVIYAVHGGVIQSVPLDQSLYDFNYIDPTELTNTFELFGKPAASFNRVEDEFGFKVATITGQWQGLLDAELAKPQVASVNVEPNYDAGSRSVNFVVKTAALQNLTGNIFLHVNISESHLIDYQLSQNNPPEVPDFEHNHVMKASLTGLNGQLIGTNIRSNEVIETPFSYSIPDEVNGEWIPENMEVTAFITSEDLNGEVLQATQEHFIP